MRRTLFALLFASIPLAVSHASEEEIATVKAALAHSFPGGAGATLRPAAIAGMYEVEIDGQIFYASRDGRFVIVGDMWDLGEKKNLTEAQRENVAVRLLGTVGDKNMIVIGPSDAKRTITVFTDVDCPYCVRLHQDVPELNRNGVKVRYLLYPRSGVGGETYKRSVAVWCASDRAKAIGIAKAGGKIDMKSCNNPVEQHYELGRKLGVNGTPTIYLDNGKRLGGYMPAANLLALMGLKAPATAVR
jgi:thiol:disulfide interchange protein DsbC